MRVRMLIGAGVALLLLSAAAGAGAAGPDAARVAPQGSNFRISGPANTFDDLNSKVVWNGLSNEYLVVWQADGSVAWRRVSAAGGVVGPAVVGPGSEGGHPGVAWNGIANEYLVVWVQGGTVSGRRLTATGTALGADFPISLPEAAPGYGELAVAWNATSQQYLVVWADERNAAVRGADIYGRLVSAGGAALGSDFAVSGPGALGDESEPTVVWNATSNRYQVFWEDDRSGATRGLDIYGRRVSAAGIPGGSDVRVSGTGAVSDDRQPAVAWNSADNEYLVIWRDERNAATRGFDIFGRRVAAGGANLGGDFRVSLSAAKGDEGEASVVWNDETGYYLVVSEDSRSHPSRGWDVYAWQVPAAGAPGGTGVRISPASAISDECTPGLAWNDADNEYLVIWEDARSSATRGFDIYGRRATG